MRRRLPRILAMLALAYGLALSGLTGAVASALHAGEARAAAQLGLICTVHGTFDPASGPSDPVPGKISCVEHCTLNAGALAKAPAPGLVLLATLEPAGDAPIPASDEGRPPCSAPDGLPPPRGPPAIL